MDGSIADGFPVEWRHEKTDDLGTLHNLLFQDVQSAQRGSLWS